MRARNSRLRIATGFVYVAFSLPFALWTLRGFVAAVPAEIEEAAYVDGASLAGSTIITVPVMLFFVAVRRGLSSGLAAGAVKG
jgi:ABC-type glycerol-3-phosphate transport system permease component